MSSACWAIVLAGGEGTRLQAFIRQCLGFACPKQYFRFCGKRSMLEHTIERAVSLVGKDRVITVIGPGHCRYFQRKQIPGMVIEQPAVRGTGAGVYLPATYVLSRDPEATVIILPSDHFIFPKTKFLKQACSAMDLAERMDQRMLLMAAVPDRAETEYGWVEPGEDLRAPNEFAYCRLHVARSFYEKPGAELANRLLAGDYLWNTMILATKANLLWSVGKKIVPRIVEQFESFRTFLADKRALDEREERACLINLYESIPAFDFSSTILTQAVGQLAILPLQGILWSDWGRPERVFESLTRIGRKPRFSQIARQWRKSRHTS